MPSAIVAISYSKFKYLLKQVKNNLIEVYFQFLTSKLCPFDFNRHFELFIKIFINIYKVIVYNVIIIIIMNWLAVSYSFILLQHNVQP